MVEKYEAAVCEFIVTEWYDLQRPKTFEQLRELSDGIGIVTNEISVFQSRKLQAMDSGWQYFDFLVTSEDVGREKPAPEIFRRGLELARARADECVFIGDSYEHDILGAAALGMQAVLTTEFTDNAHGPHHLRIQYLNELPDLLPRIANRLQAKS